MLAERGPPFDQRTGSVPCMCTSRCGMKLPPELMPSTIPELEIGGGPVMGMGAEMVTGTPVVLKRRISAASIDRLSESGATLAEVRATSSPR